MATSGSLADPVSKLGGTAVQRGDIAVEVRPVAEVVGNLCEHQNQEDAADRSGVAASDAGHPDYPTDVIFLSRS